VERLVRAEVYGESKFILAVVPRLRETRKLECRRLRRTQEKRREIYFEPRINGMREPTDGAVTLVV
jgi:hypothetical protein